MATTSIQDDDFGAKSFGDDDFQAKTFGDVEDGPNATSFTGSDSDYFIEGEQKTYRQRFIALFTAKNGYVFLLLILCIALGTVNRVVYKEQLVPMAPYAIFISDLLSCAYTLVYFLIFFVRKYQGIITPDQYHYPKFPYIDPRLIVMGFMDATGQITGIYGARKISGYLLTLLPQAVIPMTMIVCIILIKARYNLGQVAGATILIVGITVTLIPDFVDGDAGGEVYWAALYFMSSLPNAISFTLKEMVFHDNPKTDIFVVNSFDSLFQLVFTLMYLPIVGIPGFGAVPFGEMGDYIHNGFRCLGGKGAIVDHVYHSCHGMPWATMVYIGLNISWNICILLLVKQGGAVLTFIALGVSLPLANLAFIWSWPLLKGKGFDPWDLGALFIVLAGLVVYRYFSIVQARREKERKAREEAEKPLPEDALTGGSNREYTFDQNSKTFREAS